MSAPARAAAPKITDARPAACLGGNVGDSPPPDTTSAAYEVWLTQSMMRSICYATVNGLQLVADQVDEQDARLDLLAAKQQTQTERLGAIDAGVGIVQSRLADSTGAPWLGKLHGDLASGLAKSDGSAWLSQLHADLTSVEHATLDPSAQAVSLSAADRAEAEGNADAINVAVWFLIGVICWMPFGAYFLRLVLP